MSSKYDSPLGTSVENSTAKGNPKFVVPFVIWIYPSSSFPGDSSPAGTDNVTSSVSVPFKVKDGLFTVTLASANSPVAAFVTSTLTS